MQTANNINSSPQINPSSPPTVQGVAYKPKRVLGLHLADDRLAFRVRLTFYLSLLPIIFCIAFAIVVWFVSVPVYIWYYALLVITVVSPTTLYYSYANNSHSFMGLFAFLNGALAVCQVLSVWQVLAYVNNCETFVDECKVSGLRVVPAVTDPTYACSFYSVMDYSTFQHWADSQTTTFVMYLSFFVPVVVFHLMLLALSLMWYSKLRKGLRISTTGPAGGVAATVITSGYVARGTEADDADKVAVGVPVSRWLPIGQSSLAVSSIEWWGSLEGFGLPIAKPELAPIIRTIFLLALAPILLVAVFAAVTLTLGTPVFFWYYVVFVTTILAPAALYYGVQYNKSGALELYALCNVALAVLQAVGIWQIVRFLDRNELFLQQCAVKNGLIVPAVANPDFDCQSYHSYEYWKSSNTVANADRTLVIYSVLMGLAIIIHLALMALSIFLYKKLAGSRTLVIAPTFSEGQMRPVDAAVAEGTEASDSAKVTTGVPVKRSESSLCEVDVEAGEVALPSASPDGASADSILSLFQTPMFVGAPEESHNTKSTSQLVEVVGIDMVERSYARRVGGFIFLTYLPPFINLTFMVVAVVLSIPLTNLSDFLTLVSPFLPLLAYYGFVLISPKMMLTYGALVWIMIGLRALALAQMFHYVSLVQRLVLSCTVDGVGKVIDAVSHPEYDCGKISSSVWEVIADHAHNSGNIYAIYLTCFFMELAVYLVLGVLAVRFSMLMGRGKVVKRSAEVDVSGVVVRDHDRRSAGGRCCCDR
ncbi:hypothetical protein FOZ60_007222 [Perkinsus olseni]|uniref:Uncharacterized protein n=1 Tax=Perkinsus olseni TaxID=32597 RepID=A0A7J6PEU4_PEROL|nr:hypothetical protein FOZ60_007222 [Perkinsus olseni]